jgi:hypothetical protein
LPSSLYFRTSFSILERPYPALEQGHQQDKMEHSRKGCSKTGEGRSKTEGDILK